MTAYTDTPQGTDNRNVSQGNLLNNNRYMLNLNSNPLGGTFPGGIIPVDHLATGNSSVSPSDGFHKQVSYINQAAISTLINPVNGQSSNLITYSVLDGGGGGVARSQIKAYTKDNGTSVTTYLSDLRAAALFSATGGVITPLSTFQNISSIVRNSIGNYTINFSYTMPFTTYNVLAFASAVNSGVTAALYCKWLNKTQNSVDLLIYTANTQTLGDPTEVTFQIYGYW